MKKLVTPLAVMGRGYVTISGDPAVIDQGIIAAIHAGVTLSSYVLQALTEKIARDAPPRWENAPPRGRPRKKK